MSTAYEKIQTMKPQLTANYQAKKAAEDEIKRLEKEVPGLLDATTKLADLKKEEAQLRKDIQTLMDEHIEETGEPLDDSHFVHAPKGWALAVESEVVMKYLLDHPQIAMRVLTIDVEALKKLAEDNPILPEIIPMSFKPAGYTKTIRWSALASNTETTTQDEDRTKAIQDTREALDKPHVYLDLETTGPNKMTDEPVQIGIIDADGNMLMNTLVRPSNPQKLLVKGKNGLSASDINGITPDMLKDAPTFAELLPEINKHIAGKVVFGYNIDNFDAPVLKNGARKTKGGSEALADFETFDVMTAYAAFDGSKPGRFGNRYGWHKLTEACVHMNIPVVDAHDALGDVKMTRALAHAMIGNDQPQDTPKDTVGQGSEDTDSPMGETQTEQIEFDLGF